MKKQVCIVILSALMLLSACSPIVSSPSSKSQEPPISSAPQSVSQSVPQSTPSASRTQFRIASLKGPTTMGIVKLMSDVDSGTARHDYKVDMYGSPEEISPKLIKGELDAAIIPCNLASVLYNKTEGEIVTAAINNLGVLYILSDSDDIKAVEDLRGKKLYTTGKGTTPEAILTHILKGNGIDPSTDIEISYSSEASEVLQSSMASDKAHSAMMLPQPYVQSVIAQGEGKIKIVLDMNEEWRKISPESEIVTGVLVARKSFIQENQQAFDELLQDYAKSLEYTSTNTAQTAQLVVDYGIVPKLPLAEKALPYCSLAYMDGESMQKAINGYLAVLFEQNPQAIGGKLPDEGFYYKAQK